MKKFFVFISLILFLTGCFKGFQITSKQYKKELLEKTYIQNEPRAKEKYKKIMAELERASSEGNEEAKEELTLWNEARLEFIGDKIKKATDSIHTSITNFLEENK